MQKKLATIEHNMSLVETEQHLVEAYGPTIMNLAAINDSARMMHDNFNPSLKFKTLDGLPAQSVAFIKGLTFEVYALSMEAPKLYTKRQVSADMPLKLTNTGEIIYKSSGEEHVKGQQRPAETKMSGAVANMIHAVDGWSMRTILTRVVLAGYEGINVHDMYLYQADAFIEHILPQYGLNLLEIRRSQPMTTALTEMRDNRDATTKLPLPTLIYGQSTEEMITSSKCYICA